MIPDADTISRQLSALEARIHAKGWDKPPSLWLLYMHPDSGPSERPGAPAQMLSQPRPPEALASLVRNLERLVRVGEPTAIGMVEDLRRHAPGCYGAAFVCEAWMNVQQDEIADYMNNPNARRLADRPTSVEVRMAAGYDRAGRHYVLNHLRGRPQPPVEVAVPDGSLSSVGTVPDALARLVGLIVGENPATHAKTAHLPDWLRPPGGTR